MTTRVLTVGIELEMAIFDGATLGLIADVIRAGAGVEVKVGPYSKSDEPDSWRVTEDTTIMTTEADERAGNHVRWEVAVEAFGFPPDTPEPPAPQREQTHESDTDGENAAPDTDASGNRERLEETISDEESTPLISGPALRAEIISPPFEDDQGPRTERLFREITAVIEAIKNSPYRSQVNRTTGFHVHVGAGLLPTQEFTFEEVQKVTALYFACEKKIDALHPKSRRDSPFAQSNLKYSTYTTRGAQNRRQPAAEILATKNLKGLVGRACPPREFVDNLDDPKVTYTKYYKLNLAGLLDYHKTIEWRQHMGTRSSKKACRWVAFVLAFVRKALTISSEELTRLRTDDKASIFDYPELRLAFFGE